MGVNGRVGQWATFEAVQPRHAWAFTIDYSMPPDPEPRFWSLSPFNNVNASSHGRITFACLPEDIFLHICYWLGVSDILHLRSVSVLARLSSAR